MKQFTDEEVATMQEKSLDATNYFALRNLGDKAEEVKVGLMEVRDILNKPQPTVEPVAWRGMAEVHDTEWSYSADEIVGWKPLYTHPPSRTDDLKVLSDFVSSLGGYDFMISRERVLNKITELMEAAR